MFTPATPVDVTLFLLEQFPDKKITTPAGQLDIKKLNLLVFALYYERTKTKLFDENALYTFIQTALSHENLRDAQPLSEALRYQIMSILLFIAEHKLSENPGIFPHKIEKKDSFEWLLFYYFESNHYVYNTLALAAFILAYYADLQPDIAEVYEMFHHLESYKNYEIDVQKDFLREAYISLLRKRIDFFQSQYYVSHTPVISNRKFDLIFDELKEQETRYPKSQSDYSPTERPGSDLTSQSITRNHVTPMLSLQNAYSHRDLERWKNQMEKNLPSQEISFFLEPKFDGVSVSLLYENDTLVQALTRGDGIKGEVITQNALHIKGVSQYIPFSNKGIKKIEIRGEVLILEADFIAYNKTLRENNLPEAKNPRNLASGSLKLKDSATVQERKLQIFAYQISYCEGYEFKTQQESIDFLRSYFPTAETYLSYDLEDVFNYVQRFSEKRHTLPYATDGLVAKINDLELQQILGNTAHHPRWATAYKFATEQAETTLKEVIFQVSRTGAVTPVAKITPTPLGRVLIRSVSLFNTEHIKEKDIKTGDKIIIERAGEVIPYIVASIKEKRTGAEQDIIFPSECPSCQQTIHLAEDSVVYRCNNYSCPAQVVERLIHFSDKNALNIFQLGSKNILKFYKLGYLKTPSDIYRLPYDQIVDLEGMGVKRVEKLKEAIEQSKNMPLECLIYALGIPFIGRRIAKILAQRVKNINEYKTMPLEEIASIQDVGVKMAQSIYDYFRNPEYMEELSRLEALGLTFTNTSEGETNGIFKHQNFVVTGSLEQYTRREIERIITQNGGRVSDSINKKINYLVFGANSGAKLKKAQKVPHIKIISEKEFGTLLNTPL